MSLIVFGNVVGLTCNGVAVPTAGNLGGSALPRDGRKFSGLALGEEEEREEEETLHGSRESWPLESRSRVGIRTTWAGNRDAMPMITRTMICLLNPVLALETLLVRE